MKVLIATRFHSVDAAALRERFADVEFVDVAEQIPERVDGADVAFTGPNPDRLRALLRAAPSLRWIHTGSAGVDRMLIPELLEREIILTNSSGAYDASIAEFVIGAMFAAAKRFSTHIRNQVAHRWRRGEEAPQHAELRDATVVVLGLGSIGGEVARLARALGMRVIGVRRGGQPSPHAARVVTPDRLVEVAREADYLAITLPLTTETRGLVSREVIAALPKHAWLINIARGPIVDEAALLEAVRERRIGGAAIDAWWEEPLPADSPWWDLENVVVTPHHSWSSPRMGRRALDVLAENLRRFRAGEPLLNVVDTRAGY